MKSFNLTMPEELLAYVRTRTKEGGFGTPTLFILHLIRKDQEERAERESEQRLLDRLRRWRSKMPPMTLPKQTHVRAEQYAEGKPSRGRRSKASLSVPRGAGS